jgi:hypothetical protein
MGGLAAVLLLLGAYPLALALKANWNTTLRQPLLWALLAWSAWTGIAWSRVLRDEGDARIAAYVALCLTGCAGVAVLGARRPGVSAWNFVVIGLLAVLLLPLLTGMGELRLEPAQELFLGATLAVPLLNYLPTRLGPGAFLVAAGCGWEMARLVGWIPGQDGSGVSPVGLFFLALGPWAAWLSIRRKAARTTEFDRTWLAYRDGFGFVWGQRMREQFNRAAHHAGWPIVLRWQGLQATASQPAPDAATLLATLRAVLKRFGPEQGEAGDARG